MKMCCMVCVKNNFLHALCEAESLFVKAVWVCQTTWRCTPSNLMMIDREDDEEDVEHDNNNFEDGSDDSNDFVHCENCKGLILFTVRIAGVDVQLGLFVCSLGEHSTYISGFVILTFRCV